MITVPDERVILLNFTDFDTGNYYDELVIYNSQGMELYIHSGSSIPSEKFIAEKTIKLEFKSSNNFRNKGFRILVDTFGKYAQ